MQVGCGREDGDAEVYSMPGDHVTHTQHTCTNTHTYTHIHVHTHCSHNDLAYAIRAYFENQLDQVDLTVNSSGMYGADWQTDIPRLRAGKIGAQVSIFALEPSPICILLTAQFISWNGIEKKWKNTEQLCRSSLQCLRSTNCISLDRT